MSDNPSPLFLALMAGAKRPIKKDYALNIGEITIAWNRLHSCVFWWFYALTGFTRELAKNLWETSQADSFQRSMTRNLINAIRPELKSEFTWCMGKIETLGAYRNAIVHTPMNKNYDTFEWEIDESHALLKHIQKVKHLKDKELFPALKEDIENLNYYFFQILEFQLNKALAVSLPDRPRLVIALDSENNNGRSGNQKEPDLQLLSSAQ